MKGCLGTLCGVVMVAVLVVGGPSPPALLQDVQGTPVLVEFDEIKDGQLINVKDEMVIVPPDDELIIEIDSDKLENESIVVEETEAIEEETSTDPSIEEYPLDIDIESLQAPEPIHDEGDVYINKDNIVPILKTLALAYTRKESPTYKDILKAGALTGYKSAFKYLGKPSIGSTLLKFIRSNTDQLDDAEAEDEETEILSELAEKYLSSHKFKMMFPESLLLHEEDMLEFAMKREAEEVMTGRSVSSQNEVLFATPRAEAVQTVLTIGPLTWLAVLGGLFSIPYFLTFEDDTAIERDDHVHSLAPSVWLQPPSPYVHSGNGEEEYHPHQAVDDAEYQQYLREYDEWYRTWYQVYQQQQHPQAQQQSPAVVRQPAQNTRPAVRQPVRQPVQQPAVVARQPVKQPVRQPATPVQKQVPQAHRSQRKNQQGHGQPQQQQVVASRPVQSVAAAPALSSTLKAPQDASPNSINAPASVGPSNNNFGTFQSSTREGDSHFKVLQDNTGEPSTTAKPASSTTNSTTTKTPAVPLTQSRPIQRPNPSPQPVFRHSTTPKAERGFVPIIKPVQKSANKSVLSEVKSSDVQKTTNATKKFPASSDSKAKDTSAKPEIKPSVQISSKPQKPSVETTTLKLSPITSGVFKTTPAPTPKAATTPPPGTRHAIFVKSSTDKSVRVVTSSSVVLPDGTKQATTKDTSLPELERPQRLVQSKDAPLSQQLDNTLTEATIVNAVPVAQPLIQARPPPTVVKSQPVARPQTRPQVPIHGGFVRTNVPTHIQVIDHALETSTSVPTTTTTTLPPTTTMPIYALDPFYGPRLSRVDVIFHQLGLETEGCREQVVCNIYKNPDVYTPFSDYLSRQLTVKLEELQKPKVSDERILRFFRYLKAAREGQDGNECLSRYPSCPTDTTRLSHKPTFSAFHKVELLMNAGQ